MVRTKFGQQVLASKEKITGSQKLRIKSRSLNRNLMFSGLGEMLMNRSDDQEKIEQFDALSNLLRNKIVLSDDKKVENQSELANKIEQKKAIRDKINAIKSELKSTVSNARICVKKKSPATKCRNKKQIKTNTDLYAETISKQLKLNDSSLIKEIIKIIGAHLSFKLSNKLFNEESVEFNNNTVKEDETPPVDAFIKLILDQRNVSQASKQMILDYKFKYCSNKISKRNKKKINKTVISVQESLDNLSVSLATLDASKEKNKKKIKLFDFK